MQNKYLEMEYVHLVLFMYVCMHIYTCVLCIFCLLTNNIVLLLLLGVSTLV